VGGPIVWTAVNRRALLGELFTVGARLDALVGAVEADRARYAELRQSYREQLPLRPVARCPFTGAAYSHSLDALGIDGPWWDSRAPNRPLELVGEGTLVAFTGALAMASAIERAPFLAKPGPGVPFVVPRLLARDGVRAVLSSLPIGAHMGYVVTYFASPVPDDLEGFNDWGTDYYQFDDDETLAWHQGSARAVDHDFDLAPYLASGRLQWIAPGDASMTLRQGVEHCPFVDLEGCRLPQLVQDGTRWVGEFELEAEDVAMIEQGDEEAGKLEPASTVIAASPTAPPARPQTSSPPPVVSESAPTRTCASCGGALKTTSKFCPSCGTPVADGQAAVPAVAPAPPANTCRHCGQPRRPGAKFCRRCGKP
jgi:hypothetical protein